MLVPTLAPLPDGSTCYEVKGDDIKGHFSVPFWQAVKFWKRCKAHGLPKSDWRKMTIQQMAIVDIFDALEAKRGNDGRT